MAAKEVEYPIVQEVEAVWSDNVGPATELQGNRVRFEPTVKAFNMSASYATSFGSGARELIQNWWDQCRVMLPDRQPVVRAMESSVLSEIAQRCQLRANAKSYAAFGQGKMLGMILDCTNLAGEQLLLLKNYGAQMTLDSLILGESTKRNDMTLAGMCIFHPT